MVKNGSVIVGSSGFETTEKGDMRDAFGRRCVTTARLAFGVFFLGSAVLKLWKTDTMIALLDGAGFATPLPLVYAAAGCQAVAGCALIGNTFVREAALGLIAYVAIVNFFLHPFWMLDGEAASIQFQLFSKNAGIMAGLLAIAGTSGWFLESRIAGEE